MKRKLVLRLLDDHSIVKYCPYLFASLCLFSAPAKAPAQTTIKTLSPPNVIVVNLDDVGPAWFPPYARNIQPGDVEQKICEEYAQLHKKEGVFDLDKHLEAARHSMPFLDHLARSGMIFDRCFSSSSLCAPSRSGLLTGRYQQRWGAYFLDDVAQVTGIPDAVPVLATNFQQAGYLCGAIGKWHVSLRDESLLPDMQAAKRKLKAEHPKLTPKQLDLAADKATGYRSSFAKGESPLDRGFDYYLGYNLDHSHYYKAYDLWENGHRVPERPAGEFLTDFFNQKCLEFVTRALSEHKHFLLYYAPMSLHGSLMPPPKKYSSQFHTGIQFTDDWAGHLLAVDEGLQNIYEELKAHGQDQNTLLILTADNGQTWYRVPPYNAPYRGGKGSGWLGGSHVPLIISWPAGLKGLTRHESHALVSQLDAFPTALAAAGLAPGKPVDGRSLLPLLEGKTEASPNENIFSAGVQSVNWSDSYFTPGALEVKEPNNYAESGKCPYYAWVQNPETLLMYVTPTKPGVYAEFPTGRPAQELFFNLPADPRQTNNIFGDTPAVQTAAGELRGWLQQTQPPPLKHLDDYQELLQLSGASPAPVP